MRVSSAKKKKEKNVVINTRLKKIQNAKDSATQYLYTVVTQLKPPWYYKVKPALDKSCMEEREFWARLYIHFYFHKLFNK